MSEFPEEGRFEYGKTDPHTGAQWVYVTPAMAQAHPKGKPGLVIWGIIAVFLALGAIRFGLGVTYGDPASLLIGAAQLFAALLLAIRAPVAVMVSGAILIISIFGAVTSSVLKSLGTMPFEFSLLVLGNIVFCVGAVFYLVEGDRPNLIYRHRYRTYRKR